MNLSHAIWLGVIQGITEFLPISSSAHLILVPYWFNWGKLPADQKLLFDVALHVGTCLAILLYFWRDLWRLAQAAFSQDRTRQVEKRLAWGIVIGCIPAAGVGALFEDTIENVFRERIVLICVFLIGIGVLMGLADRFGSKRREVTGIGLIDAFLIGIAQAFALLPGFSRSGITITAGLMLGLNREAAARFSFLLSAPITIGAALWSFRHVFEKGVPSDLLMPMVAGSLVSAVVGWLCIAFLLNYLRTRTLSPFVGYRVVVGLATLLRYFRYF